MIHRTREPEVRWQDGELLAVLTFDAGELDAIADRLDPRDTGGAEMRQIAAYLRDRLAARGDW